MNRHDHYQAMLLFPDELTPEERADLDQHLLQCTRCRKGTTMITATRASLARLHPVPVPSRLRSGLQTKAPATGAAQSRKILGRGRQIGLAAIVGATSVWALFSALGQRVATPVNAYAILTRASQLSAGTYPYSGNSLVTFTQTPWSLLPPRVADYAGHHKVSTRWWVQDATHFRVDVRVLKPALERGTITAVLNGSVLTIYDARSGRATVLHQQPLKQLHMTAAQLLSFLQNGAQFNGLYSPSPVAPNRSISDYLASLRTDSSRLGVPSYARIVRQTKMLGHPVDVIDFGPLSVMAYDAGRCSPATATPHYHPPTGPCHRYRQPIGWARVYVARDHPLVLRFEEHGIHTIENVLSESIKYRYQVMSLRLQASPPPGALSYQPPVAPVVTRVLQPLPPGVFTYQGGEELSGPGFLDIPRSTTPAMAGYNRLATTYFAQQRGLGQFGARFHYAEPALPVIRGIDILFAQVHHWVKIYTSWHGQANIYVTGPFLLVQERQLAKGLPRTFTTGASANVNRCRAWTGTYADGEHWIAFQRARLSVVMSSNTLTRHQLTKYVSRQVCH